MTNKERIKTISDAKLPVIYMKEGNYFIAYSPALDLATQAKDMTTLKTRFNELITIFFEELFETNSFDDTLTTLGWQKKSNRWNPPVIIESGIQEIPFIKID